MRDGILLLALCIAFGSLVSGACDPPPWEMPCPEGWVMDADQNCYDPAGDDDSAAADDDG